MTRFIDRCLGLAWGASRAGAVAGGAAVLGCAVLVLIEVMLRRVLNVSLAGVDEISSYVLAASSALAFSFTLFRGGHIRIDALYNLLPPRLQSLLDILASVSLALFACLLTYYASKLFSFRAEHGSVSSTPMRVKLVVPMGPWLVGMILFSISTLLISVHTFVGHLSARYRSLRDLVEACRVETSDPDDPELAGKIGLDS